MEPEKDLNEVIEEVTVNNPDMEAVEESVVVKEKPVVSEPTEPEVPKAGAPVFTDKPKKKGAGMVLGMILLAIIAAGGVGFGVWAMMDGNSQKESLNKQIAALTEQNDTLMEKIGDTAEEEEDNVDSEIDTTDYIYVGEWEIKIKKPSLAKALAYEYNDFNDSLVITLTTQEVDEFNRGWTTEGYTGAESEIILERYPENTKDKTASLSDGIAEPTYLFTLNGYDYFGIIGGTIDTINEFYASSDNYSGI